MESWIRRLKITIQPADIPSKPLNEEDESCPATATALPALPLEIWIQIVQLTLPPLRFGARGRARMSLLACYSLVSRDWCAYAQGELFRKIVVSTGTQCTKLAAVCCDPSSEFGLSHSGLKKGRHLELSRMVKNVRIGSIMRVYSAMHILPEQLGPWSTAVVPLLRCFTEMEELRMSEVYDCKLELKDLVLAKGLHTLFIRFTSCPITPSAVFPNLRYLEIDDLCLRSGIEEEREFQYEDPQKARYNLILSSIAPNLSVFANFPRCWCNYPAARAGFEPDNGTPDGARPSADWKVSPNLVVVKDPRRMFEWWDGKISPSKIGWFLLPRSREEAEKDVRFAWSRFSIICLRVWSYRFYPQNLHYLADVLDDLLPLSSDATSTLENLREIRIPSFEMLGVYDRITSLKWQEKEMEHLRNVCRRGSRRVRVVVDDSLAAGEYDNSREMEEGVFHQSFWNGVRSLQSLHNA